MDLENLIRGLLCGEANVRVAVVESEGAVRLLLLRRFKGVLGEVGGVVDTGIAEELRSAKDRELRLVEELEKLREENRTLRLEALTASKRAPKTHPASYTAPYQTPTPESLSLRGINLWLETLLHSRLQREPQGEQPNSRRQTVQAEAQRMKEMSRLVDKHKVFE